MRNFFLSDSISCVRFLALLPMAHLGALEPEPPTGAAPQQTVASFDFASALPQGTMLYISMPDLDRSAKNSGELAWSKLSREEEVKAFIEKPLAYAKEKGFPAMWKMIQEKSGEDLSFLQTLQIHSVDIAFTGFRAPARKGDRGLIFGLVSLGLGDDAAKVEAAVRKAILKSGKAKIEEISVEGTTLALASAKNPEDLDDEAPVTEIAWFLHKGRLLLSLNREPAEMAIKALQGKSAGASLLQDKEYQLSMSKVSGNGADMRLFVRIGETYRQVTNAVLAQFPAPKDGDEAEGFSLEIGKGVRQVVGAIDKLGIGDLGSLGMAWSAQGNVSMDRSYLSATPGPRKGLLRMISSKPIDRALLAKIPKEAQAFSIASMNLAPMWDILWDVAQAAGEEKIEQAKAGLAAFEAQAGFKVKEDFFDALGETMMYYQMPMQTVMGGMPEMYFLLEARDREKLEKSVIAVLKFASEQSGNFQMKENTFEGGKSYSLSFPELKQNPMLGSFAPTIAFADKFMIVGLSKSGVKKTIKRLSSPDSGEGAAAIPDFAKFASKFPKEVTGLSYSDPKPTMTSMYQAVQMFAPMATAQFPGEFPIDFASMPSAVTISKHFFGSAGYSAASENGWETVSYASSGVDSVLTIASIVKNLTGLGFGVAMEMQGKKRGQAHGDDMGGEGDDDDGDPHAPPPPTPPVPVKELTPVDMAKQDLLDLKSGVTIFKIETGKYPSSLEELLKTSDALPEGCLPGKKAVPLDPWKRAYVYALDSANKTYKLRSMGPNGLDDGGKGDDVVGN